MIIAPSTFHTLLLISNLSIDRFHRLSEGIRDIAVNDIVCSPEDAKSVCGHDEYDFTLTVKLTSFIAGQRYRSRSIIRGQCYFPIPAPVFGERCFYLSPEVRDPELPILEDGLHHTATIFRGIHNRRETSPTHGFYS